MTRMLVNPRRLFNQFTTWKWFHSRPPSAKDNFVLFFSSYALWRRWSILIKFDLNLKFRLNQDEAVASLVDETPPVLVTSSWMTAIKLLDNLTHPLNYDKRMRPANASQVDSPLSVNVSIYVVALGSLDSSSSVYCIYIWLLLCVRKMMVLLLRDTADLMPLLCVCVCLYWSEDLEGNLCLPSFLFSDAKTSTLSSDDDDILLLLLLRHYKLCPTSSNTHNEKL